jgi:predicted ribosomally synthesized peptide with nif11-like leader
MSEEQLKAFLEAVQADVGLQQKLQGVTEPDAIAAIAKEAGFSISAEEIKKAHSGELEFELTDEQLEQVARESGRVLDAVLGFAAHRSNARPRPFARHWSGMRGCYPKPGAAGDPLLR